MAVQPIASEDHVDVLIVGAGISGIGVAHYLQKELPSKSYLILESRQSLGGTWDLFRYPSIRSDSDLHTYAYEFKPWRSRRAIAGGDEIMAYLREAVAEDGIDRQIRYGHKVCSAAWSSQDARWTVEVELQGSGQRKTITCSWLFAASGYYRYDQGYTPAFPGLERFKGPVVHPQQWPEKLDYRDKRVVIIGSGATAVTLLPALAEQAQHVTMLQRTPTYVVSLPGSDPIANLFNKVLPAKWAYAATRYKNIRIQRVSYHLCQTYPNFMRWLIRLGNKKMLPDGYPVDVHFKPPYNPWDQRLCAVPDGDMFKAIKKGKASVVTDHIETFTETGIRLKSGQELPADIVVPATGFNLQVFGGIEISLDGKPVDMSKCVAFKGMMLSGLPNFAFMIGYTNSSWTLKVGLVGEHFCRLLAHMDQRGYAVCMPQLPTSDMPTQPLLNFGAGYVQRMLDHLPRQGTEGAPWIMQMHYLNDIKILRDGPVEDPCLRFEPAAPAMVARMGAARMAMGS